jgi:hypothetical protein
MFYAEGSTIKDMDNVSFYGCTLAADTIATDALHTTNITDTIIKANRVL